MSARNTAGEGSVHASAACSAGNRPDTFDGLSAPDDLRGRFVLILGKHMRHVRTLAALALLTATPALLRAQSVPSPYEYVETTHAVGAFGGYMLTDRGERDLGLESAPIFGPRYTIRLTGPLLGEVALGFAPTNRTIFIRTSNEPNPPLRAIGETGSLLMTADAGLKFSVTGPRTWNNLAPFVIVTGGIATDLSSPDPLEEAITDDQVFKFGTSFAASAGVGTDFFVTERLSIRLDARDHLWRITAPIGLTGGEERESDWTHNFSVTLGTAIHF